MNGLCRIYGHGDESNTIEDLPLHSFDLRLSLGLDFPLLRGISHTSIHTVNMSFLYRLGLDASAWSDCWNPWPYDILKSIATDAKLSKATKRQHAIGCYAEHADFDENGDFFSSRSCDRKRTRKYTSQSAAQSAAHDISYEFEARSGFETGFEVVPIDLLSFLNNLR